MSDTRGYRRHQIAENRGFDLTAMIDVVFQLILFFMLTSSLVRPNQIELDLPQSTSGVKAQEQQTLVVAYWMEEGKPRIRLNDEQVAGLEQLRDVMRKMLDPQQPPRIDLQIDRGVPYQDVISVMDSVRDAGFPKFSLNTLAPQSMGRP